MSAPKVYALALCQCTLAELPLPASEGSTDDEFIAYEDLSQGGSLEQGAGGFSVAVVDSSSAVLAKIMVSTSSPQHQRLAELWRDYLDPEKPFEPVDFFNITPDGTKYVEPNGIPRRRVLPGAGRKPGISTFELMLPKPQITYGNEV